MPEKIILKDLLFNEKKLRKISVEIAKIYPKFVQEEFIQMMLKNFPHLELKARITCIAEGLKKFLPDDYIAACNILLKSLPKPNNPDLSDDDYGDFIYATYNEFVARYGNNQENLDFSLQALRQITMRFSAEDAIRYFINKFERPTMDFLLECSRDKNYHVRRLASEGTRPKLPWSQKINIDYKQTQKILDNLYCDKTRYVTRSVANHLNDISKIDADFVLELLKKWQKSAKQSPSEMNYITKHALRNLIKNGDQRALQLLGFNNEILLKIDDFQAENEVFMDDFLDFSLKIASKQDCKILVDYIIYFQNKSTQNAKNDKNFDKSSKKVFKLKIVDLSAKKPVLIQKKHVFRQFMTTRKIYEGWHRLEIQINGKNHFCHDFMVKNAKKT